MIETPNLPAAPAGVDEDAPTRGRTLQFVMKLSKYCNLRCTYCYEFAFLDDRRRMSLDQLATMFRSVADYAERNDVGQVVFTWHGGEPFMVPLEVYDQIKELQRKLMPNLAVMNGIQTNLTILTDRHLEHLRSGRVFDMISISFDVSGDQRVDKMGRPTTQTVLDNMQRLIDASVDFGAICVLARNTVNDSVNLFHFFHDIHTSCRFLPFHRDTSGTGDSSQTLSQAEIIAALGAIFDAWVQSPNPVSIRPLAEFIDVAGKVIADAPRRIYDKETDEWVFVVNPNGDLWGISEIEDNRFLYGNVFASPLETVLASDARRATFAEARRRIDQLCGGCPYLGHCTGYSMADVTDGVFGVVEREGCHVRGTLDHIVARFRETGIADDIGALGASQAQTPDPGLGQGGALVVL
ncbi:MAG: radical SAM protein [Xanthobacteraceae bacterium]